MIMISNFLLNFINFCVIVSFLTKLLTLCILFSTSGRTVLVAKLVILCFLPLISFILALRVVLASKLVKSSILSSIFFILVLYASFRQQHHLFTTLLCLLKSIGTGTLSTFNLATLLFKLFKPLDTIFS